MSKEVVIRKIGLKIRELRESKNLTLMELSVNLDIEYNNLIRIEKGRTNPTIGTLLKISQGLNVKLVDIVDVE
ncbi:DNA-binding XRE family transcriptional regulator [Dysgonomonas alginatilytica]|uniref:DNA-binding XRE family transcriptional regulator n=1 Tax=Dysgonomonas alginatilytica TaxID=1605892 RepID=A0A2V3PPK5_9BACT|nr:helix-turn-helix transcriptional regulator [Dysgonomonas alginatilytica]PXV63021.1 DNA-binding XRE family transcriptional regulator [Dysgonomonas alginatilytica]